MNERELRMLNGFAARLVVPGWYAPYWVKNLSEIAVVDHVFEKFWMKPAYRIPDTPCGCVEPGTAPKSTVPIHRMTVRSFIVAPPSGARVAAGRPVALKGIAFDGGYGVREVQVSDDGGATWRRAQLGPGVEVAQRACRSCHSTDYIVMQPRGDAKQWEAVVTKMIKVFGASISDEDAKAIVRYLSTAYGK